MIILQIDEYIDLIIPRGSAALVRSIKENTRIPVMGHAEGICHIYIDRDAIGSVAEAIVIDSKTDYPSGKIVFNILQLFLYKRLL